MKTKLLFLLIILIQISCKKEKSELERSWILVEQIAKPSSKGMYIYRGLLVDFEDDQMTSSYITSKDETKNRYWIEDDFIKFDTVTFGKIIHLSKDSLIVEEGINSFDMHFRPLEESSFSKAEKENITQRLIKNSWSIETQQSNQIFYFDTMVYNWMLEELDDAKCIVYETVKKDWNGITDYEWWKLKHFDDKLILGFSSYQTDNAFFQMTNNSSQIIDGQYMDASDENWTKVEFKKMRNLSSEKLHAMKEIIIGEWEIENIIEPNLEMIDSVEHHAELIEEGRIGISKTNLKEHTINFLFKENGGFSNHSRWKGN